MLEIIKFMGSSIVVLFLLIVLYGMIAAFMEIIREKGTGKDEVER